MSDDDRGMKVLELCVFFVIVLPIVTVYHGWLFSILWRWFAVGPLGAPPLRLVDAIGVSVLVGWFTSQIKTSKEDDEGPIYRSITHVLVYSFIFGLAAIVHSFQ